MKYLNRLWIQLSLAFAAAIGITIFILLLLIPTLLDQPSNINRPNPSRVVGSPNGLRAILVDYYDEGMSLEESIPLLDLINNVTFGTRWSYRLIAADGTVVYDTLEVPIENAAGTVQLGDYGLLIYYVALPNPSAAIASGLQRYLPDQLSRMILGVGILLGTISASVISIFFTRSIRRLQIAAQKFSQRDFSYRVNIGGSAELDLLAKTLNQMAQELEESDRLRKNLVTDIAHELRTPLSVMEGSLRAILDDVYPLNKTEILHIYDQTRLLHRLVNDLHELTLADAKRLPLNRQELDFRRLLQDVGDIFESVAETNAIRFHLKLNGQFKPINVDEIRVKQVLHNLLVNALRHTQEGGSISLIADTTEQGIQVQVMDTGEGIPPDHIAHIFDRFYRVDAARNRGRGGSGLGLAISKAIITAHGGDIRVISQNTPPQGTNFIIDLPYDVVQ